MNPDLMHAVVVRKTPGDDWNELAIEEVPRPVLNPGEVLVKVEACSVNRADLLQRRGLYPPPPGASSILGLDFAGLVAQTSPDEKERHEGERVFGIVSGGSYGRYVAVPAEHLVAIPKNLSFIEAAATAEVFFTAYLNLFLEARMRSGEVALIHGGAGGVGTAAIQLANQSGISAIITAGSSERVEQCLKLGASYGINYKEKDFAAEVMAFTGGKGVDVILDPIGASYLDKHIEILKTGGRLVFIGLMGGNTASIRLAPVLSKRLRLIGSVLRSRSRQQKAQITEAFKKNVVPLLESGKVRPVVDRVYPIQSVEDAHKYLRDGKPFGKVVLSWEQF